MLEKEIHLKFATQLRQAFRSLIFFSTKSETGTKGQRIQNAKLSSKHKHPDVLILNSGANNKYNLLAIEIKKPSLKPMVKRLCFVSDQERMDYYKKKGTEARILKQQECLRLIYKDGGVACFACSESEAMDMAIIYLVDKGGDKWINQKMKEYNIIQS